MCDNYIKFDIDCKVAIGKGESTIIGEDYEEVDP
jgi:hypothetical protein